MSIKSICICSVEAPFVRGGAEIQLDNLASELARRDFQVARVTLPFVWTPVRDLLKNCLIWRWIDLERCTDVRIDLVICSKFPTYVVKHPRKVTWLIHQFRQAYELYNTPYSCFADCPDDHAVRQAIINLDTRMLSESRAIFTEARRVADRLKKYNGLEGKPLYHPPQYWDRLHNREYGNYVLSVGRLVTLKRVDLLLKGLYEARTGLRAVIVGEGPERAHLETLSEKLGLADRVTFAGPLWGKELVDLYAGARAVYYAPFDEDYGLVVPEAFRSRKPVITASDSGGTLEFVSHGDTGLVVEPEIHAIADGLSQFENDTYLCARMGDAGFERVSFLTWDYVISHLVQDC